MNGSGLLRRVDRVVTRDIAGETLLVPIRGRTDEMHHIFALNPVAAHVWKELERPVSVEHLVESVCSAFDVDKDRAHHDVTEFLRQLREADLIREA